MNFDSVKIEHWSPTARGWSISEGQEIDVAESAFYLVDRSEESLVANLKALADHLGLSQATVSRALNGYETVNAATPTQL